MKRPAVRSQPMDPRYTTASINPLTLRYLALVAAERGFDTRSLCRGLGFDAEDLQRPGFRISYRQGSLMIGRAYQLMGDSGLGLAIGSRQTPVSWGLVGFGMMSCATLLEATEFGLQYQQEAGSLAYITREKSKSQFIIAADPLFYDSDIEMFLIEEMFSSMLMTTRFLVGAHFKPAMIEVVYPRPPHVARYRELFGCPVNFSRRRNRFIVDKAWMNTPLATHDALVAESVRDLIESSLLSQRARDDFGSTIERAIRENLRALPPLERLAADMHTSERTLRRRLSSAGFSYQSLLESVRKARALELLTHSTCAVSEVAAETGFNDVRNFRKAFKRWTGVAPTEVRDRAEKLHENAAATSPPIRA